MISTSVQNQYPHQTTCQTSNSIFVQYKAIETPHNQILVSCHMSLFQLWKCQHYLIVGAVVSALLLVMKMLIFFLDTTIPSGPDNNEAIDVAKGKLSSVPQLVWKILLMTLLSGLLKSVFLLHIRLCNHIAMKDPTQYIGNTSRSAEV